LRRERGTTTMESLHPRDDARKPVDVSKARPKGSSNRRGAAQLTVTYKLKSDPLGHTREAVGRFGWTLLQLHLAGAAGLTSLERPAPRWSHYVWVLRGDGLDISTTPETHSGSFAGMHGRYHLRSPIEILEIREPMGSGIAALAQAKVGGQQS
jgi:hypothetical protein